MSEQIEAIIQTRRTAAQIFAKALANIENLSETEVREKLLSEVKNHNEIYSEGWYSPPPAGVGVLFATKPFERLEYSSMRHETFWPREDLVFGKESVGLVYFSPIDRKTNMIGDVGLTIYKGDNSEIKEHIKKCYKAILEITKYVQVGMKFSDICEHVRESFKDKFKFIRWVTVNTDPNHSINLGHTLPGSFEKDLIFGDSFEEIKETIKLKRISFNETIDFKIPKTCAFTVETRLEDINNPDLPPVYFHFIVCFDNGQKTILENYSQIFKSIGMDYMENNVTI